MFGLAMPGPAEVSLIAGIALAAIFAYVFPFWRICRRMGFSPWLSLLVLISPLNVVLFYYLAFARWPAAEPEIVPRL